MQLLQVGNHGACKKETVTPMIMVVGRVQSSLRHPSDLPSPRCIVESSALNTLLIGSA